MSENETLEYKRSFNTDVIETAVAFANTSGGEIWLGVDNQGEPLGTNFSSEALRDVVNRIANATEPSLTAHAELRNHHSKQILVLQIPENPIKPVSTRGRCFKRAGSVNRQMSPAEIAETHLSTTGTSMDAQPLPGITVEDLDTRVLEDYVRISKEQGRRRFADNLTPGQILTKLDLIDSSGAVTRAAALLFSNPLPSRFSHAKIHAGVFRQQTQIANDLLIEGSLTQQLEQAFSFFRMNLPVRYEITGNPKREEVWQYPLVALREAVINAVCHRDYNDTSDIQIKVHEDTLSIWSPGGLPHGLTLEDLQDPNHPSRPRNPLISQIFYDMGYIERYGSGIARMTDACHAAGLDVPNFELIGSGLRLIFKAKKAVPTDKNTVGTLNGALNGTLNGTLNQRVYDAISAHPGVQRKELIEQLEIPTRTLARCVKELSERGLIQHQGSKKTGGYFPL